MSYALIVNPADTETPFEQLEIKVLVRITGYLRDALLAAKRISDHHAPRGHAWLVIAGELVEAVK